ncbi:aconitate hydratase [Thermocoleostomius sinensis A174]|uniref:Aconitate hydratase A n=2 Tax=Thermocoleostomius TaxID=3065395 RepID=A0A9E8Z9A3_9CYAN|nr:aconitate hydratase [Thermocoleostomius sinensis A174]
MMDSPHQLFDTLQRFTPMGNQPAWFYSLPKLEEAGIGPIAQLPVSIRLVLESVLRNYDDQRITEDDIRTLANWQPQAERTAEIPFVVARILLQDFTGVPVLVDLAAMRSAADRMGHDPSIVEPLVPVDLVVDHSVQVDFSQLDAALRLNMQMEFARNQARYQFLKWGMQAFNGFSVVPPGIGIVHQVNLEYLARGILVKDGVYYPDTLVGTDSHTTMINGLGIVGWGVGGIEAEAGMLGQPIYFLTPDVVGVHLSGMLQPGVTATDLVLRITELLRQAKVVGKFVEFYGEGAANLTVTDRATISNMAPEYGATMGFFPVDEETCRYLLATGRSAEQVNAFRAYFQAQGLFGIPQPGDIAYSEQLELDLTTIEPSVAGPKRPQDRIALSAVKSTFQALLQTPTSQNGYGQSSEALQQTVTVQMSALQSGLEMAGGGKQDPDTIPVGDALQSQHNTATLTEMEMIQNRPTPDRLEASSVETPKQPIELHHGSIVIAAITSCTNTSNPSVMLAAGLLAKKAVEHGLTVAPGVKTSLAPGSRVVTEYLTKTGLQAYLDQLGFQTVGYGCTTCIGNSGPLEPHLEAAITSHDLVVASVLSGNRNFEARVHQSVKANFLMSPPLVIAFALAGRIDIDLSQEPLGTDRRGNPVYLSDIWPSSEEIKSLLQAAYDAATYQRLYRDFARQNPLWSEVPSRTGKVCAWEADSTYIQEPPYFDSFNMAAGTAEDIKGARSLALFGDSVTTDHISPAGAIKPDSPAGLYLQDKGVKPIDFNSYGSRRGNHEVMMRGTFANVRIKNLMVPGTEGGVTVHQPSGEMMTIYDAAMRYQATSTPLVILAGQEYGTGSSRDWAAKGAKLLGVKAVIAQSFERIHRSNLVGMGVLPCQFQSGDSIQSLQLDGSETFDLIGLEAGITPRQDVSLVIHRADGSAQTVPVILRIDTPIEVDYYLHGGILPYVLRQLLA